jgi:hypothetical protein
MAVLGYEAAAPSTADRMSCGRAGRCFLGRRSGSGLSLSRVRAAAPTGVPARHSPLVHAPRQSPPSTTRADNPIATIAIMSLTPSATSRPSAHRTCRRVSATNLLRTRSRDAHLAISRCVTIRASRPAVMFARALQTSRLHDRLCPISAAGERRSEAASESRARLRPGGPLLHIAAAWCPRLRWPKQRRSRSLRRHFQTAGPVRGKPARVCRRP